MPLWSMKSKKHQRQKIKKFNKIFVVNHLKDGGFQSG